jgi:hypothetical protein
MNIIKRYGNFYLADPQELGTYEKNWIVGLSQEISSTSPYKYNIVVNITWFDFTKETVLGWVEEFSDINNTKLWLCGSIDGACWIKSQEFYELVKNKGYAVSIVGFSDEHWYSWFPSWLFKHNKNVEITLKENPKYLYLSYNRKPREHRINLVKSLIDLNLADRGYITFEKNVFPEIDFRIGTTEADYYKNISSMQPNNYIAGEDIRYSRPEDLTSLGNLEIWNDSYLIVCSESEIHYPYHVSEKTWKPIMGLRPFVLNSNPSVKYVLKRLGFYTPAELFEDSNLDKCNSEGIVHLIQKLYKLSSNELYDLWNKQLPMLEHNRNRFIEIAIEDNGKILNWSQSKTT